MNISTLKALALQIKTEVIDGANTALRIGTMFESIITYFEESSGWAFYADTQYTEANPFLLSPADDWTTILNNGGVLNTAQMPTDVVAFLENGIIQGNNGDGLEIMIQFKAKPVTNSGAISITTAVDIGGSLGRIFPRTTRINRGSGEIYDYISSISGFQGANFEANGGTTQFKVETAAVELFDFQLVLTRTHKARS